jgi:hypothetical protein
VWRFLCQKGKQNLRGLVKYFTQRVVEAKSQTRAPFPSNRLTPPKLFASRPLTTHAPLPPPRQFPPRCRQTTVPAREKKQREPESKRGTLRFSEVLLKTQLPQKRKPSGTSTAPKAKKQRTTLALSQGGCLKRSCLQGSALQKPLKTQSRRPRATLPVRQLLQC